MKSNRRSYKREKYFIKKNFQIDFILKFCLLLLGGVILSTVLLFIFSQDSLTSNYANSGLEIKTTGTAILPVILITNLVTLGILCCCSIVIMLFISHKIAGPMFRFEKDIKRISNGDLSVKINLRQQDQLKDIAKALNLMIDSLYSKVNNVDKCLKTIEMLNLDGKDTSQEITDLRTSIRESFILNR